MPGTPGTVDLTNALRRLTPKTTGASSPGRTTSASSQGKNAGYGWRTPDSIMSTGSRSALSSLNSIHYPEKLKVRDGCDGIISTGSTSFKLAVLFLITPWKMFHRHGFRYLLRSSWCLPNFIIYAFPFVAQPGKTRRTATSICSLICFFLFGLVPIR